MVGHARRPLGPRRVAVHPGPGGPARHRRPARRGCSPASPLLAFPQHQSGGKIMSQQAYPHPQVRTDWLDRVREDIIEPDLPIVDPHHHLWHDRAVRPLPDGGTAGRPQQRPQHRRHRVHAVRLDASPRRPRGLPPGGRDRGGERRRRAGGQRRLRPPRSPAPASSASPICAARSSMPCWTRMSRPAAGASAASATSSRGTTPSCRPPRSCRRPA